MFESNSEIDEAEVLALLRENVYWIAGIKKPSFNIVMYCLSVKDKEYLKDYLHFIDMSGLTVDEIEYLKLSGLL